VTRSSGSRKRVVVVGGGITGLAAAHRLLELDAALDVVLLEASGRLGGVLETVRREGYLIERSADNFITNVPWAIDFCRRIGFDDQLVPTTSQQRQAMVVHGGRLERVPPGFMLMAPARLWPLVTTPLLSTWGKLRLLAERFIPRRGDDADESLGSFARRRFGRETFERIIQPLVGGIYTADPEKLSLRATLPRFVEMERRWGSLIRAARHERTNGDTEGSGARYGLFVAPREGMTSLVQAVATRLPEQSVRLNTPVEKVSRTPDGGWTLQLAGQGAGDSRLDCDGVIVAARAPQAARMLESLDPAMAADLNRIPYAGTSIVTLAYRREDIGHALDGFGFVVPAVENRRILAGSFSSVKFSGRAPADRVLVRVFIGGACQSELADLDDEQLGRLAVEELRSLLDTRGAPLFCDITRWPQSMPQYHVGHCRLVAQIEAKAAEWSTLELAGNAYHGVGIPNCIHSGQTAAERVHAGLLARSVL
jgi:protoporphyrinogen/coproporphyrinogen III oxidase